MLGNIIHKCILSGTRNGILREKLFVEAGRN